jgi:aminoglycoside phosphotransferase (APT) family kinase protein
MAKSPLILAALAKDAVRHLDFVQVKSLNAGADGAFDTALLTATTGEHYVVRIANTQSAGTEQEVELQALRALGTEGRSALPFKITSLIGETKDDKGARALIFDFVYGSPVDVGSISGESELARSIGLAIAAIHKLPLTVVENAHLPEFQPEDILRARTSELDRFASTGKVPSALLSRWEGVLEDASLFRFQPTVVHGALNGDTVLEEDGRNVAGVLAWSSLKISDPAEDLSWILGSENDPFAEAVLAAYSANRPGVDASIRQRAVLYSEFERARWLMHGVNKGDQSIIDDAVEMLTTLADDVEAGVIGRLIAAPISVAIAEPIITEVSETFISIESDDEFEVIEINETVATIEDDSAVEFVSLETAPIDVISQDFNLDEVEAEETARERSGYVDDKTKPIELPEKSDNELF